MAVVAQRVARPGLRDGRALDERLLARFPALYAVAGVGFARLGPRSRLRQALLRRQALSGWAASNRGDYELMAVRYSPDLHYEFNPELTTLGLPAEVDGRDEWLREIGGFMEIWTEWRYELEFILDLGDRLLTLGTAHFRGGASGIDLEVAYAQVIRHRNGVVTHERDSTDWTEALELAGLPAGTLDRLNMLKPRHWAEMPTD